LAKIDEDNLFKEINNLIINPKILSIIQKKSFNNAKIFIEKSVKIFDKIKIKYIKN
jgi:hypothetical protein